jgi:hypothetical protein
VLRADGTIRTAQASYDEQRYGFSRLEEVDLAIVERALTDAGYTLSPISPEMNPTDEPGL